MTTNKVINMINYDLTNDEHKKSESMSEDPTFEDLKANQFIDENDDLVELDNLKTNKTHENRIKSNKSRRFAKSCEYPEENVPNISNLIVSASLPDHFQMSTSSLTAKNLSKKFSKNSRRSRRERSRGLAKKNGAGKYAWGTANGLVDVVETGAVEDPSDLNYESDKEDNCEYICITPPLTDEEIENHVTAAISEFYEHGDTQEVAIQLEEYNFDKKQYLIVVIAINLAFEHKSSHRELTSVLISDLYHRILKMSDYELGFKILIKNLNDTILDTPDSPIVLGNFIARAIADDCIGPCFVTKLQQSLTDPLHLQSIDHAASLLDSRFSMMKLDAIWGLECGGFRPVKSLVTRILLLLSEYIDSADIEEATRCLKELEVPHLHHHLIYEGVVMAIEDMKERTLILIAELFQFMYKTVIVTVDQLKIGFNQVYEEIEDIFIDVPLAYPMLEKLVAKCESFLPKDLVKKCPVQQRGRKRYLSESDGKFKEESI